MALGAAFRDRARYEADRYGTDAWVFVRELLQNARDAGARKVWIGGVRAGGRDRVICRDDGGGMSYDHARRYLFTLYATSKHGQARSAGRFGIGFWSVLRFAPETILVRSRPRGGEGWQVRLDGNLEHTRSESAVMNPGTEIVLERRAGGPHPEKALREAVVRDAPYLRCRGGKERPLEVLVNDRRVDGEPDVGPPSLSFRRRGLRGVVALAHEPLVEVFAHGLRVREAAFLEELFLEGNGHPPPLPAAAEGLAPRFILDSSDLSVMLARGDAREDRALRRLVAVGYRELNRLVRAELDRHARLSLVARAAEHFREAWSASLVPRLAAFAAAAAVIGVAGSWFAVHSWNRAHPMIDSVEPGVETSPPASQPYSDLKRRYRGPGIDSISDHGTSIGLSYQPEEERPLFAAFLVTDFQDEAEARAGAPDFDLRPYPGAPCSLGCLEVELVVDAEEGLLRLPTATGHILDAASVSLNGEALPLFLTDAGEPAVLLDRPHAGLVRYRSAEGPVEGEVRSGPWPALPPEAVGLALALEGLPVEERVRGALDFVRSRVVYDRSAGVIERYRAESLKGGGLFAQALVVGAGDCDVQNALLTAILGRAGVTTRLAVGWIGVGGTALPGLHAWAEYLDLDGNWRAIDASAGGPVPADADRSAAAPEVRGLAGELTAVFSKRWKLVASAALLLLIAAGGAVLFGRRAWRRSFHGGSESDLADLLRGAALRPQTFAHIHPVFRRKVVPLLSGRAISLDRARAENDRGRLALGSDRSTLAKLAARKGRAVLDKDRAEGAAVGEALGAVDLDRWQDLLDRARTEPAAKRVEQAFESVGEPVQIRVAAEVSETTAVLDGTNLGLGRRSRWVVVDEESELWRAVRAHAENRPNLAVLALADAVAPRLGLVESTASRCLAGLAEAALGECAGGGP